MRHRSCIVSTLTALSVILTLLDTAPVFAAASGANQALGNGAGLYAVYCSDCHGNAPALQSTEQPATDAAVDYAELVAIAQRRTAEEKAANPEDEEWPEW